VEEEKEEQLRQAVDEQEAEIIELRKSMEKFKKMMSLRRNHQLKEHDEVKIPESGEENVTLEAKHPKYYELLESTIDTKFINFRKTWT